MVARTVLPACIVVGFVIEFPIICMQNDALERGGSVAVNKKNYIKKYIKNILQYSDDIYPCKWMTYIPVKLDWELHRIRCYTKHDRNENMGWFRYKISAVIGRDPDKILMKFRGQLVGDDAKPKDIIGLLDTMHLPMHFDPVQEAIEVSINNNVAETEWDMNRTRQLLLLHKHVQENSIVPNPADVIVLAQWLMANPEDARFLQAVHNLSTLQLAS